MRIAPRPLRDIELFGAGDRAPGVIRNMHSIFLGIRPGCPTEDVEQGLLDVRRARVHGGIGAIKEMVKGREFLYRPGNVAVTHKDETGIRWRLFKEEGAPGDPR